MLTQPQINLLMESYWGTHGPDDADDCAPTPAERQEMADLMEADSPKDRLITYLTWNGIHGYTGDILEILGVEG